jgi:bifunctional ADP-heptose synthase (sugar kinase/adenylyltransferase)
MKILVVGDRIEDRYIFGRAERLCPEAPVPVIIPERTKNSDGGAALVVAQLEALGADVVAAYGSWSFKERYFVGSHLVCRVDKDSMGHMPIKFDDDDFDAFVVSDYGKGAMDRGLAAKLVETGKPLFVDAKHHWHWYAGSETTIFPNEHECLDETFTANHVVRKLGKNGCEHHNLWLPATVSEVVDVTGAGDIFMAGFVYAWSIQLQAEDCLRFANALAGESCRHIGTFVVPKAFAEAELGRLRASREPQPQTRDYSLGSIQSALQQQPAQDQQSASIAAQWSSLVVGCYSGVAGQIGSRDNPLDERIHPVSPSAPTGTSDAPAQEGPKTADLPDKIWPWEG